MRAEKSSIICFLQNIKEDLANDGISTIGLFGSFARDEASVYSDIDIAIGKESDYLNKRSAYDYFDEVEKIKNLIKKKFHRNSDIFDLCLVTKALEDEQNTRASILMHLTSISEQWKL